MLARDRHIGRCGIVAHLLGVASPGDRGTGRRMGQAESDRCLGKSLHAPVYQESELLRFGELLAKRLSFEAACPHVFALKSAVIGRGKFSGKDSTAQRYPRDNA